MSIDSMTKKDIADLVEAAIELASIVRLRQWIDPEEWDGENGGDQLDALDLVFARIGLPMPNQEEFKERVQDMLTSGLPPHMWRAKWDAEHGRKRET